MSLSSQNVFINNRRWLPRVLGTIIVLALIIFIGKGCNGANSPEEAGISDVPVKLDSTHAEILVHESLKVKLPDGVELDAYKGGIEDQLVGFLNDPASKAGKDVWFDFDNLNFKSGSAEITEASMTQIKNIDAILKAYPRLKIKIGGYTDKTGDSLGNAKLSQSRADAVSGALKTNGANTLQLLGAEGYGSQYAKAAADAPDVEKVKDRRISVSVREK